VPTTGTLRVSTSLMMTSRSCRDDEGGRRQLHGLHHARGPSFVLRPADGQTPVCRFSAVGQTPVPVPVPAHRAVRRAALAPPLSPGAVLVPAALAPPAAVKLAVAERRRRQTPFHRLSRSVRLPGCALRAACHYVSRSRTWSQTGSNYLDVTKETVSQHFRSGVLPAASWNAAVLHLLRRIITRQLQHASAIYRTQLTAISTTQHKAISTC